MKLADCIIVWTPDRPEYATGMRGKARLFPAHTPPEHVAPFPCRAGQVHPWAHDQRLAVRHDYLLSVYATMVFRDGLPKQLVRELLCGVEEFHSLMADRLTWRRARRAA